MENWTLSWTKLTLLNGDNLNTIPIEISGIYRLSYKHPDGSYYVYYVGQADDLKMTLLEHLESEKKPCLKTYKETYQCYFRYAIISEQYVRESGVAQLYKHYKPACNDELLVEREDVNININ